MMKFISNNMMKLKIVISAIIINMLVGNAYADSSYYGKIIKIQGGPSAGNKIFIVLEQDQTNKPTCLTDTAYHYTFDATTPGGKNTLSLALAAYSAKKEVYLGGYQTCSLYSTVEDLSWIRLK